MKRATLEQTASTPEARRLVEIAINVDLATRSAPILRPDTIIRRPDWAKSMKPKSGRVHFELKNENGHVPIPPRAMYVQFTNYRDERPKFIEYGKPTFYDEQGNTINGYF